MQAPEPAPAAQPDEPPKVEEAKEGEEEKAPDAPSPAAETPTAGTTPGIVSTKTADPIELGDYACTDEVSEVHGTTDWEEIFEKMKAHAESQEKEVAVRPSKNHPDDS